MISNNISQTIRAVTERPFARMVESFSDSNQRVVHLMRGLPSCGKSTTARRIAGSDGLVIETDAFFQNEQAGPQGYCFDSSRIDEARQWTHRIFRDALSRRVPKIVIDRGNGLNDESKVYAQLAVEHGYQLELTEPDSPWWQEIRILLRYRPETNRLLDYWANELARLSERTHHVPADTIRDWMDNWADDLEIDEILDC